MARWRRTIPRLTWPGCWVITALATPSSLPQGSRRIVQLGRNLTLPIAWSDRLARSGALGSAIIWLRRLCSPDSTYPVTDAATTRFAHLVRQIEQFVADLSLQIKASRRCRHSRMA